MNGWDSLSLHGLVDIAISSMAPGRLSRCCPSSHPVAGKELQIVGGIRVGQLRNAQQPLLQGAPWRTIPFMLVSTRIISPETTKQSDTVDYTCDSILGSSEELHFLQAHNASQGGPETYAPACTNETRISTREWKNQDVDNYLLNYPGGQEMSFAQFTNSIGVLNFRCGLGQECLAGQLCQSGIKPIDWEILYAVQQWNFWMNSMYQASAFAISMVQEAISSLIVDLDLPRAVKDTSYREAISILIFSFLGAAFAGLILTLYAGAVIAALATSLVATSIWMRATDDSLSEIIRYDWNEISYYFPIWESRLHSGLTNYSDQTLNSPLSSQQGIFGAIKGGEFVDLELRSKHTVSELQQGLKTVILTRAVVLILRSMNAFITRGKDKCTDRGLGGAWHKVDRISYCDENGVMMNIILADENRSVNSIHNGRLISMKYGLTAEFLTVSSWTCQQTYNGTFAPDPYNKLAFPSDPNAECVANLPVCDCTTPEFHKLKKSGKTTVEACRKLGLPI
ncbi:uncharacterized protein MELLADRAFT_93788 [Melampsora larici-populina 98AG31]|uniref:DUF7872 domain-containing protein n=1 Tax=Melampsora larici-populina (strain 98AG31 / pathotype 3-4-7) TaxID=747676 RepID=F4S594_MELLP|nr:uncharacterized protein MELLADRAFT_93788 [Melampsora larici-populina 98AG31]EGG00199.1 hypothetical protein MELLADRAFT_93788 [Melampsora larici-populina 98AG31]